MNKQTKYIETVLLEALTVIMDTNLRADNKNVMLYALESLLQTIGSRLKVKKHKSPGSLGPDDLFIPLLDLAELTDTLSAQPILEEMKLATSLISEEVAVYANQVLNYLNANLVEEVLSTYGANIFSWDGKRRLMKDGRYRFKEQEIALIETLGLCLQKRGNVFVNVLGGSPFKGIPYLMSRYRISDFGHGAKGSPKFPIARKEREIAEKAVAMLRKAPEKRRLSNLLADIIENFFDVFSFQPLGEANLPAQKVNREQLFLELYKLSQSLARMTRVEYLYAYPDLFDFAMKVRTCLMDYALNTIRDVDLSVLKEGKQSDPFVGDVSLRTVENGLPSLCLRYEESRDRGVLRNL